MGAIIDLALFAKINFFTLFGENDEEVGTSADQLSLCAFMAPSRDRSMRSRRAPS
ncbi:MAG: hypothetical protein JWO25_1384 [Alphaproteobacteria bacterium]|nr:hypothetical protein [Alphaproteobacteria bacterium]